MTHSRDYYRILQVDVEADAEVITAAFRALARRLHPDKDPTGVDEHRMTELNRAYAVLRDPRKRSEYDAERLLRQPEPEEAGNRESSAARSGGLAARVHARGRSMNAANPRVAGTVLPFGRYSGLSLQEIAGQDAEYLRWLARHSSGLRYRREIEEILRETADGGDARSASR